MATQPTWQLSKPDYIAELCKWGRASLLSNLHRLGLKQGDMKRTDAELAELIWDVTAPMRERNSKKAAQ